MTENQSILDRVLQSKEQNELAAFSPLETLGSLLKQLSNKEEDVLKKRHGLLGEERATLEEIGAAYKLTRERIRQIENASIAKLKAHQAFPGLIGGVERAVANVIESSGGSAEHNALIDRLFRLGETNEANKQAFHFLIEKLLDHRVTMVGPDDELLLSWKLAAVPEDALRTLVRVVVATIEAIGQPALLPDVIKTFRTRETAGEHSEALPASPSDEAIVSALDMAARIAQNPFDEYGLVDWGTVVPRRMGDKIYLILKREAKPLHFTAIADLINRAGFDKKRAHAPTVHNELILSDRYVLVGRGMYALAEWGYKPGVVADVIAELLRESGPLTRAEIIEKVLATRFVKKNTVYLALTDRERFAKLPDNRYQVAETQSAAA